MHTLIERVPNAARRSIQFFAVSALLLATAIADAQPVNPNYQWTLTAVPGAPSVIVGLDSSAAPPGEVVEAWSFGICHDTALLDPDSATSGATTQVVNGGSPPDFEQINIIPNSTPGLAPGETPGFNQGVVISFLALDSLPPGSGYELLECTYTELGAGATDVLICDTTPAGLIPVASVLAIAGQSVLALTDSLTLQLPTGASDYELYFTAPDVSGAVVTTTTLFDVAAGAPLVAGWTYGVCHDPAILDPVSAATGATTAIVNGGSPPDFEQINLIDNASTLTPPDTVGVNQGVVISFVGSAVLGSGIGYELLDVTYAALDVGTTELVYCETTPGGVIPVEIVIAQVPGVSADPGISEATVVIDSFDPSFVRGDCDDNAEVDLTDVVFELEYLFTDGSAPGCADACDLNDDGALDLADPIYLATFLFFGGSAPPQPTTCGSDLTDDGLGCDAFASCP
ncbi:MAG: hypothetical protein AAF488_00025 [Planctomycetota bacterium]